MIVSNGERPMSLPRWPHRRKKLPPSPPTPTTVGDLERGEGVVKKLKDRKKSRRLDRINAVRHIDYDAVREYCAWDAGSSVSSSRRTTSLDLPGFSADATSFRIGGECDGEVENLCRSLGLSGPDDFAIPVEEWKAIKARSASDIPAGAQTLDERVDLSGSRSSSPKFSNLVTSTQTEEEEENRWRVFSVRFTGACCVRDEENLDSPKSNLCSANLVSLEGCRGDDFAKGPLSSVNLVHSDGYESGGRIRGARPPVLNPPDCVPSSPMPLSREASTWDLVKPFAALDANGENLSISGQSARTSSVSHCNCGAQVDVGSVEGVFYKMGGGDFTASCSFTTTSNDDDASSTTTEGMYVISPNSRFKCHIGAWAKGRELGRGSYGTVYEAISDDGFFFAVKEVSLLNQGDDAQQSIEQLEQEIIFLSDFEHENIVRYLGTEKGEAKLYIFLELVTQGSLASLYHKYQLKDSQVSAYTRQILNGLKYLHNRNVVHRDIKCANILVGADGSVKLADFGLAKETTKFGMLRSCKGSVYWMAPEVINPKMSYGSAADIWSLGCTVLEMLTQKPPYSNLEWTQAFYQIGGGLMPDIPDSLSKDAKDFICQCLHVNPADRPTASELLDHAFVRRQLTSPLNYGFNSPAHGRRN